MKINGTNAFPEAQPSKLQQSKGSAAEEARETPGARDPDDATTLASSQQTTAQLAAHLTSLPDVRQERVTALRQAVHSGQYQVSNQQIADAIHANLLVPGSAGSK